MHRRVVHFVPNVEATRTLGSELQRKSAAILSIEKDENPEISVVKALKYGTAARWIFR